MMNEERDKFLTEAMGMCYCTIEYDINWVKKACPKCGGPPYNYSFTTWDGFGRLWIWAQKQSWWTMFCFKLKDSIDWDIDDFLNHHIDPDRFATTVYEFLKVKENE